MKKQSLFLITISITSLQLGACQRTPVPSVEFDDESIKENIIVSFDDSSNFDIRHGYTNGNMFLSYWDRSNVTLNEGVAGLSLYDTNDKNYGSEVKTYQGYLYGYFSTRMKTFKKEGTVQSFFTYNGGWNRWDEIDIEFLGKDTTKAQFNYYENGVGGHEYLYDLGFDSSLDFHEYGFKWEEDKITWFVDNKPVHAMSAHLIQWGNIYANVWAGNNVDGWLGKYTKDNEKRTAYYEYFSYVPLEENVSDK